MIGNGSFSSDASPFQSRMFIANEAELNERNTLHSLVKKIGVTPTYMGEDVHSALVAQIERYAKAVAHAEMLRILSNEDFYLAMAHSASKIGSS